MLCCYAELACVSVHVRVCVHVAVCMLCFRVSGVTRRLCCVYVLQCVLILFTVFYISGVALGVWVARERVLFPY